ncbi:hypothetical protein KY290_036311 [Solanum tuberosum]|uniref:Uncharacterized protein n=1 Tax=Solanum tuberosum TaxID=4113 RepID=A0ABQ7TSA3_SOLTU|nr:hypothetical protein KY284_035701 [Solanum tuberosum]KAH0737606.1 hypothetical protein KY290_036311 [Solanum tuberosum]
MELLQYGGIRTRVHDVDIDLSEEVLGIILDVPCKVIRSLEGCKSSKDFVQMAKKFRDLKCSGVLKKYLKGEYQLNFKFVNKNHDRKKWKNGIAYGYLLNMVFHHFNVPLGRGVVGTIKQTFSMSTLIECKSVEGKMKAMSQVSELLEKEEVLK